MRVTGTAWGDAGSPPDGQGVLGGPATDIQIDVVQEDLDLLVARGAANRDYEFRVVVDVPAELKPGVATLVVRSSQRPVRHVVEVALAISAAPASGADGALVEFAPAPEEEADSRRCGFSAEHSSSLG